MTFEDNIHQGATDTHFQNSLREAIKNTQKSAAGDDSDQQFKVTSSDLQGAPSFFEQDLQKWMTKKFTKAIGERQQAKEKNLSLGCIQALGTAN